MPSALPRSARLHPVAGRDSSLAAAFVGRQPIFDAALAVYGYELLYRRGDGTRAVFESIDAASAEVALDAFLEFGVRTLVGDRRAFVNFTSHVLLSGFCRELPPERVVLEILENQPCDAEVVRAVSDLAAAGYTIALDDFSLPDGREPLLPFASMVKLDVLALDEAALRTHVHRLRDSPVALVAERVETEECLARCRELGFTYFQGYFFARPTRLTARRVPVERLAALRVLALLADEDSSLAELTAAIAADLKLSYQVLRLVNSAFSAVALPIDSLAEAIVRVGRQRLRGWVSVMALSGVTGKPPEVLTLALVRAQMCEALARASTAESPGCWYTAGLFSALDLLFDAPLTRLIDGLPLPAAVVEALTTRTGDLGQALNAVIAFERGDWNGVRHAGLPAEVFTHEYREALERTSEWETAAAVA